MFTPVLREVERDLPWTVKRWDRLSIDSGDTVRVHRERVTVADSRDATYIRYQLLVDRNAHRQNAEPVFEQEVFYGRLRDVFEIHLPSSTALRQPGQVLLLALIQPCPKNCAPRQIPNTWSFLPGEHSQASKEVVDISTISAVVGRFSWNGVEYIIDWTDGAVDPYIEME